MQPYSAVMERVRQNSGSGIWPQSSANTYFIFCVGQSLIKINAFMAWSLAEDINVKPLFGKYNGQQERSFIANSNDMDKLRPWFEDQESILHIGRCNSRGEPEAMLEYLKTGVLVGMGRMVQIPREKALRLDSWTLCPLTKCYFVCQP